MNISNYIEAKYRELTSVNSINLEFSELYDWVKDEKLKSILCTLHYNFLSLFRRMNERLPTNEYEAHFWADPSRELIQTIEITLGIYNVLKNSESAFEINEYYFGLIKKCREFLRKSGGSPLPPHMEEVELYYTIPIFTPSDTIIVENPQTSLSFSLKLIGSGSYANVFKYKDSFYDRNFVVKRAKKDLSAKKIERFKREYDEMKLFSSPYILEVYRFDETKIEYIMEYMNYTLDNFIKKNITSTVKRSIINQILKGFEYLHSNDRLHRDISPKNILLKEYHDTVVVKIADFGLVKIPDSVLTSKNTEFKGYFNDPSLVYDGFDNYSIQHETYALTRIIYYVLTGKTNTDVGKISDIKLREFIIKGLNSDRNYRFQSATEMIQAIRTII